MTDTENNSPLSDTTQGKPRFGVGLLAAAPYVFLMFIYIATHITFLSWAVLHCMSRGDKLALVVLVFILWAACLALEFFFRRDFSSKKFRWPWFSLSGVCFLLVMPLVEKCALPVVLRVPRWHHAEQVVEWDATKPDGHSGGLHRFYIVLDGHGNEPNYKFTSAYMNWSGGDGSGINGINPQELTVSHWVGEDWKAYPLTLQTIRNRINNSGLSEEKVTQISEDIWLVLQQAKVGKSLHPLHGYVEPVTSIGSVFGQEYILGGIIWIILLTSTFLLIGCITVPKKETQEPTLTL